MADSTLQPEDVAAFRCMLTWLMEEEEGYRVHALSQLLTWIDGGQRGYRVALRPGPRGSAAYAFGAEAPLSEVVKGAFASLGGTDAR